VFFSFPHKGNNFYEQPLNNLSIREADLHKLLNPDLEGIYFYKTFDQSHNDENYNKTQN
jgi:hypothetical protein